MHKIKVIGQALACIIGALLYGGCGFLVLKELYQDTDPEFIGYGWGAMATAIVLLTLSLRLAYQPSRRSESVDLSAELLVILFVSVLWPVVALLGGCLVVIAAISVVLKGDPAVPASDDESGVSDELWPTPWPKSR